MNLSTEERYESLWKSVNEAIKKLCGKIGDISAEVKDLREKLKSDKLDCKDCICVKSTGNLKKKIKNIEEVISKYDKEREHESIKNEIKLFTDAREKNIIDLKLFK